MRLELASVASDGERSDTVEVEADASAADLIGGYAGVEGADTVLGGALDVDGAGGGGGGGGGGDGAVNGGAAGVGAVLGVALGITGAGGGAAVVGDDVLGGAVGGVC